ncbi:MAG: alpha/beta fold hydrolase [Bacteroidia bacterium]
MRKYIIVFIAYLALLPSMVNAQTIDTLIDVGGGFQLHFMIIKGEGAPILFESGAGDNGSVWGEISPKIALATGATIITYDRLAFDKKPMGSVLGFAGEIKALETGLQKLGFANKNIMLVSHSMGGMFNSYYASRHPNEVKTAVLIDASTACAWSKYFNDSIFIEQHKNDINYLNEILDSVINNPMPLSIPIIDIVAENQESGGNSKADSLNNQIWFICHQNFVSLSPQRKSLFAYGAGHHVFEDNPSLVINAIVTQYANNLAPERKTAIFEKAYAIELINVNEKNRNELKCGRSEDNINDWGYELLNKNELKKALAVFELNCTINPFSWNVYDSLGEAYLKAGKKELAIKSYKKSIALNPKNESGITVLKELLKNN